MAELPESNEPLRLPMGLHELLEAADKKQKRQLHPQAYDLMLDPLKCNNARDLVMHAIQKGRPLKPLVEIVESFERKHPMWSYPALPCVKKDNGYYSNPARVMVMFSLKNGMRLTSLLRAITNEQDEDACSNDRLME